MAGGKYYEGGGKQVTGGAAGGDGLTAPEQAVAPAVAPAVAKATPKLVVDVRERRPDGSVTPHIQPVPLGSPHAVVSPATAAAGELYALSMAQSPAQAARAALSPSSLMLPEASPPHHLRGRGSLSDAAAKAASATITGATPLLDAAATGAMLPQELSRKSPNRGGAVEVQDVAEPPLKRSESAPVGGLADYRHLKLRVLMVDDQKSVRSVQRGMLMRLGVTDVTEAESLTVAVRIFKEARDSGNPFNLITMDHDIPDKEKKETGAMVIKELRAAGYAGPIIFITSHAVGSDQVDGMVTANVKGVPWRHIIKPCARKALEGILGEIADGRFLVNIQQVKEAMLGAAAAAAGLKTPVGVVGKPAAEALQSPPTAGRSASEEVFVVESRVKVWGGTGSRTPSGPGGGRWTPKRSAAASVVGDRAVEALQSPAKAARNLSAEAQSWIVAAGGSRTPSDSSGRRTPGDSSDRAAAGGLAAMTPRHSFSRGAHDTTVQSVGGGDRLPR